MKDRAVAKTWSWAVVSFFVIWATEVASYLCVHGGDGLGRFAWTAGLGTALACVVKSPVYLVHERAWSRP